ncbi:hypothetical protein WN51_12834 [Melipona quadrifasciata]|uniref:Uncharacterized protein n=1 Tax=Melipona quadrifasciata TaxID=166423 RepID=A0A0N0BGW4_9HYME|nr:hypothetical protein WN51_12834 [Melipona quadrifasciata]
MRQPSDFVSSVDKGYNSGVKTDKSSGKLGQWSTTVYAVCLSISGVAVVVGTGVSVGTAGGASAGIENGLARVCARGAASTAYSEDGGFRFEAAEERPRARPYSDGLIYTTKRVYEATLP